MLRKLAILVGFIFVSATLPAAASMPSPAGADVYPFPYPSIAAPVLSDDPATARPLGVGSIAVNYDVLSLQIKLGQFADKVDVYVVLHVPILDPYTFFLLRPDNALQTLGQGLVPWKKGTVGPIDEKIFGDLPAEYLPKGTYQMYIVVTPEDTLASAYVWLTHFSVGGWTLQEIGAPIMSAFGEDGSFDAVLFAISKGYALEQVAEAAVTQRLRANGDCFQYLADKLEAPYYEPLNFLAEITLATMVEGEKQSKPTPQEITNSLKKTTSGSMEAFKLLLTGYVICRYFFDAFGLEKTFTSSQDCFSTFFFGVIVDYASREECNSFQTQIATQSSQSASCIKFQDGGCVCQDPKNKLIDFEKSFSGLAVSVSGPQFLTQENAIAEGTWTATVTGGTGPYAYYFHWGDGSLVESTEASVDHVYGTRGTYNIVVRVVDTSDGKEACTNPYLVQVFEFGLAYTCAVDLNHVSATYRYADPNIPPVIYGDSYRFIANGVLSGTQFAGTIDASKYTNRPESEGQLKLKLDTESLRASDIDAQLRNASWEVRLCAMTGGRDSIPLTRDEFYNSISGSSGEGTGTCQLIDSLQSTRIKEGLGLSRYDCNEFTNLYVWCEKR